MKQGRARGRDGEGEREGAGRKGRIGKGECIIWY